MQGYKGYIDQALTLQNIPQIDGIVQERCNSIANALGFRLSCTNPSIHGPHLVSMG